MPKTGSGQISVIIPARNASSTIGRTLSSLDADKALIHEILLVDDGSQDGTANVAAKAADLHGLPLTVFEAGFSNAGAARNFGLDRARGDRLFFLDADDEVLPGGITLLSDALDAAPAASLAIGASIHRGQTVQKLKLPGNYGQDNAANARRYLLNELRSITVGSALVAAKAAAGVRFPESINLDEDTIYWAAILSRCAVTTIRQPVLAYNLDEARMSRRFVSDPHSVFNGIAVELDKLRSFGFPEDVLQKRKSFISMRIVRHLTRQRRFNEAADMMRVSRLYGGGGLNDLKALQYRLRIWRGYATGLFGFGKAGTPEDSGILSRSHDEKQHGGAPELVVNDFHPPPGRHGNGSSE